MMASCGEEVEEVILAAGMEEVAELLTNKNLYLSFYGAFIILGIKMELSKDGLGLSAKGTPVYMIGGEHLKGEGTSKLVYEFDIADDGRPTFKHCSSVPPLPIGMPAPFVVKHLGQTFVLYGGDGFIQKYLHIRATEPVLDNCFLVLSEDGMGWKSTPPPFYDEDSSHQMWFHGAIGSKLYVSDDKSSRPMCSYDITTERWEEMKFGEFPSLPEGSITLSVRGPITEADGQSSYVVISNLDYGEEPRLCAALVDGDGNIAKFQTIHYATRRFESTSNFKLIELMYKGDSSTFALVFMAYDGALGLTVFRVSISSHYKKVDAKRQKLSFLTTENDFLEVEVLVNQRYMLTEDQLNFHYGVVGDIIFR
ncbi:hypothetical protein LINGRAHAP2_LOCUS19099 [Linum grandiflorum]